jgi:outer membrane immunogenic protein
MTSPRCAGGLALAGSVALCVSVAAAADLPVPPPMTVPVASAPAAIFSWTGFYLGGHVGGGIAGSSWSDPFTGANNAFNSTGFLGGGQIGADYQLNRLVLGAEGDFSWTGLGLKGSDFDSKGNSIDTDVQWTSTITGRIGMAFDRLLVYGKGGLALAQDHGGFTDAFGNTATANLLRTGWIAGAGLEYGFSKNWSARIEYDYLDFGPQALNFTTPTTPLYTSNARLNVQEIKAGVNFRFGP